MYVCLTKVRSSCVLGEHFTCQPNCMSWLERAAPPPQDELSGGGFAKGLVWLETVFLHVCVCVLLQFTVQLSYILKIRPNCSLLRGLRVVKFCLNSLSITACSFCPAEFITLAWTVNKISCCFSFSSQLKVKLVITTHSLRVRLIGYS